MALVLSSPSLSPPSLPPSLAMATAEAKETDVGESVLSVRMLLPLHRHMLLCQRACCDLSLFNLLLRYTCIQQEGHTKLETAYTC